jgi:hypothetical protein
MLKLPLDRLNFEISVYRKLKEPKFKWIVSRDVGVLLMISLDSYEIRTRAGLDLFFILMQFSYLNLI